MSAKQKGRGPYEGKAANYDKACHAAHAEASKDGHGVNDWLVVDEVRVRGNNPIVEYLVKLSPGL